MPYKIAFIDDSQKGLVSFETFLDFLFIFDIIINFFSAYEDPKIGLEMRHKVIALNYLTSWFFLDLLSW